MTDPWADEASKSDFTQEGAYASYSDTPAPTNPQFALLDILVKQIDESETLIEKLSAQLKEAAEKHTNLTEQQLPELLDEMGLSQVTTKDGLEVEISENIFAAISEKNQPVAFKWLNDNGHGGLMKRAVTVAFNKGQEDAAHKLMDELRGKFAAVSSKTSVHPSTLKAWVKEALESGIDFPMDAFGVYKKRVAKIKRGQGG
jgi:hypothetical protein